ncbi:chaperone for protein-folding within the ER [Gloeopeniophorella convolvens]|nr:chaperone for protein-folding within the ER [Gloeopeniophorella convolvens]
MLLPLLAFLALPFVPAYAQDIQYDSAHNVTPIIGTWASGSKAVQTGPGFANPANLSFTYPPVTGQSFSFSGDGFYEIARYRFTGNGSAPQCLTGVVNWVHGQYALNGNGSITMTPFGDGYQQIQAPCLAVSNWIEPYNDTELYQSWQIFQDPIDGYKLHMFAFDRSPVSPLFQVSATPQMLPTQPLRNVSQPSAAPAADFALLAASGAPLQVHRWGAAGVAAVGALLGGALLVFA